MQLAKKFVLLVFLQALLSGAAFAEAKATSDAKPTAAEAKALAEKAVAYIKTAGTAKAFAEFNARDGKWIDRDLYIIVIAFDGDMLVHGTNPKLVGKPQLEMRDRDGKLMSKEMVELAKSKGTGWVDYVWPNPLSKKFEPKSTYVIRIPGFDGFLGVGVYK
jgi:signal transduction histidine kinase